MTNWAEWFRYQLKASGDGFEWAFNQVSPKLRYRVPQASDQRYMGLWSPARHIWHVTEYERCLALPSMRQWLGASIPGDDDWLDDDETWATAEHRTEAEFLAAFQAVRAEQIALLEQVAETDWSKLLDTVWGSKPLSMVVTKTYQHTFEHGDTLLRMALWREDKE